MSSSIERAIARINTGGTPVAPAENIALFPEIKQARLNTLNAERQKKDVIYEPVASPRTSLQFDLQALARDGFLTPETMQGGLAEQYRLLKHALLTSINEAKTKSAICRNHIAITSALMGEGKTFTSFNLAMSLAMERDLNVLLVDGDVIGRSLSQMTGLNAQLGLVDALLNPDLALDDIVVTTNVPRLTLLPAGQQSHQHATELMSSDRMRDLSRLLASYQNDQIVLFDAPPLLATSLAIALVDLVDQVLVVVEEGRTPCNAVTKALSMVAEKKNTSIVLNKCKFLKRKGYYQ
ncbi:MAG: AAA family ATPase [Gammaproteobacteria bacterium]